MKETTPSDIQSEFKKLKEELTKNMQPICPGGECDRRHTCKYTVADHSTYDRIMPVKSGEFCGYFKE